MAQTVFYSWQSDVPKNRAFVREALDLAISELSADASVEDAKRDLIADQDTEGVPGSPAIVDAILSKIKSATALVADLTFVATRPGGGKVPNPNVMLEYGFALHALTDARVIAVFNEVHGSPEDLPFDLAHRRWPIRFRLEQSSERQRELQKLAKAIKTAIAAMDFSAAAPDKADFVALMKQFCRDDTYAPDRTELLAKEVQRIRQLVQSQWPREQLTEASFNDLLQLIADESAAVRRSLLFCGRWGTADAVSDCIVAVRDLSFADGPGSGYVDLLDMRELPSALGFYWLLAGSVARDDLERARVILDAPLQVKGDSFWFSTELYLMQQHIPWKSLKGADRAYYPESRWARPMMAADTELIALTPEQGARLFSDTEHLIALQGGYHRLQLMKRPGSSLWFWVPGGEFLWDNSSRRFANLPKNDGYVRLVEAGLLGGTASSANEVRNALREFIKDHRGFVRLEV